MFDAGTFAPFLEGDEQPFDNNLGGLETRTSTCDNALGRASVETTGHAFLDAIPVGKSLMEQFQIATTMGMDGPIDEEEADDMFRRITMELPRRTHGGEKSTLKGDLVRSESLRSRPATAMERNRPSTHKELSSALRKGKGQSRSKNVSGSVHDRAMRRSSSRQGTLTRRRQKRECGKLGSSGSETLDCLRGNMNHLLLYNWFLLRMDNIRILSSQSQTFNGRDDDFALLRLLAQSHANRRWWTIEAEDIACDECVGELETRRAEIQDVCRKSLWHEYMAKRSKIVHCDGGLCSIVCIHRKNKRNHVAQFFHKLGRHAALHMRNILLEVSDPHPNADIIISAAHNVVYYFRDVQNMEVNFHLENGGEEMTKDTWTRVLCALVQLEACLPKGGHLRVKGIQDHTELQCGWLRRCRGWHS